MDLVHIDLETYSECNLLNTGAWVYSRHPSTEVLCLVAKSKSPEVQDIELTDQAAMVDYLASLIEQKVEFCAWNSFFEYSIILNALGVNIELNRWHDTMARSQALALPRALGQCAMALGFDEDKQKDKNGKNLIRKLCMPGRDGVRLKDAELLQQLLDYCKQDVNVEESIHDLLSNIGPNFSDSERRLWVLDQEINARGIPLDRPSINKALCLIDERVERAEKQVDLLTQGELTNIRRVAALGEYLTLKGLCIENCQRATLEDALQTKEIDPSLKLLIELRLDVGRSSMSKYSKLLQLLDTDDRARGSFIYHGATTGRWASVGVNVQNLPRGKLNGPIVADMMHVADNQLLNIIFGNSFDALQSAIRSMIKAEPGKTFLVADYSSIEARVLPWLAGQNDVLEVFENGGDIYKFTASQIYKKPEKAIDSQERFVGKCATLGLGYGGGAKAFQNIATAYGIDIAEDLADKVKKDWRGANQKTVEFWKDIEQCALLAVLNRGVVYELDKLKLKATQNFLFIRLPSGRYLSYYNPSIGTNRFGSSCVEFWGSNSVTRKWQKQDTYGGKLAENVTQAVARDLLAHAMVKLDDAGYPIIMHIHDEVVAEVDEDKADIDIFINLMCQTPAWAHGLPVTATGEVMKRFKK